MYVVVVVIQFEWLRLLFYSVNDDNQHDKRTLPENSDVHSSAKGHKVSKMKRSSAPLLGTLKGTVTGVDSATGSMKKVTGEMETLSADMDDGSSGRAGAPCNKIACVRTGLKPRCFAGATWRSVLHVLLFGLDIFVIFYLSCNTVLFNLGGTDRSLSTAAVYSSIIKYLLKDTAPFTPSLLCQ